MLHFYRRLAKVLFCVELVNLSSWTKGYLIFIWIWLHNYLQAESPRREFRFQKFTRSRCRPQLQHLPQQVSVFQLSINWHRCLNKTKFKVRLMELHWRRYLSPSQICRQPTHRLCPRPLLAPEGRHPLVMRLRHQGHQAQHRVIQYEKKTCEDLLHWNCVEINYGRSKEIFLSEVMIIPYAQCYFAMSLSPTFIYSSVKLFQ